jgi:hypothetical protein
MLASISGFLIVLVVFGIPFFLIACIISVYGTSLAGWIKDSSLRVHRRFFCTEKGLDVEVDFRPSVFSSDFRDVADCSAFEDGRPTCGKDCLNSQSSGGPGTVGDPPR